MVEPPPRRKLAICRQNFPHSQSESVIAHVEVLCERLARRLIMGKWWQGGGIPLYRLMSEPDQRWNWNEIARWADRAEEYFGCYVLLVPQSGMVTAEGAVLYRIGAQSLLEPGQGTVHLQYLAVSPLNRKRLMGNAAAYKGIGTELVALTVYASYINGFRGRVLCEPLDQSLGFYIERGFEKIVDQASHRPYYELSSIRGEEQLVQRRWI